jgi:hypothetical protein
MNTSSNSTSTRSAAARLLGTSLMLAASLAIVTGCGGPRQDAGTIDISASKKVAAEKGNPRAEGGPAGGQDVSRGGR